MMFLWQTLLLAHVPRGGGGGEGNGGTGGEGGYNAGNYAGNDVGTPGDIAGAAAASAAGQTQSGTSAAEAQAEAGGNIAGTSGGIGEAIGNAMGTAPGIMGAVIGSFGDLGFDGMDFGGDPVSSGDPNAPSPGANEVGFDAASVDALADALGLGTSLSESFGMGSMGTIGGSVPGGPNAGFGVSGPVGVSSGTIGPGSFGGTSTSGYGGLAGVSNAAAMDAAAGLSGVSATGGLAGMAGPDTVGAFGVNGITSNDQDQDATAPFGGQSVGMAPGAVAPSVGMGFGMDRSGISIGAPYSGADIDSGMVGATGVPGSRADALAEQAAQMAAQAAATITGRGATVQEAMADMAAQTQAQAQQQAQAQAQAQAQTQAQAQQQATFDANQVAAAIASMGTRPGMSAPSTDEETAQSQAAPSASRGPSTVSFAGQPARAASSISVDEAQPSAFSNAVSAVTNPTNLGTAAINAALGIVGGPLSALAQAAMYGATGQSIGGFGMAALTGGNLTPGGVLGGGPTAGFGTGASNPNAGQAGGGGEGGGFYDPSTAPPIVDVANAAPLAALPIATGTTGGGSIPTAAGGQYGTPYGRTFQGLPNEFLRYGYGPEHVFYAAHGGRVKGPLSKMRHA